MRIGAATPSSTTPARLPWRWRNLRFSPAIASACLSTGRHVQQRVLPGRGPAHLRQIVEALAQARAETSEADHLRATATLNRWQPRRALILWITDLAETAMRPEVIDGAMQLLRRHVLLFVAMAQPDVEAIANARPKNVEEMFRASAAQELTTPPRTAAGAAARTGRTHARPRSRAAHFGGAESIFEGERTGDGVGQSFAKQTLMPVRDTLVFSQIQICAKNY